MKLTGVILAIAASLIAFSCASVLPDLDTVDIAKRTGNAAEPTLDPQVLSALSSWFGWQLAGAMTSQDELSLACDNINSIGGSKWMDIGLDVYHIREPICEASHSPPNPNKAFPNSIPAISEIIERQLVGSFKGKDAFGYLCDNLAFFPIDQFYLTNENLFKAVCDRAGKQVPPRPFGIGAGRHLSEAAAFAARNTATILYSTLLAAGADSDLQLNVLCAHAPNYIDNVNAEMLNGTLMESTLCSIKEPLSVEEAQSEILSWTSRLFVTVLENIGDVGGWLDWLCEHLDAESMNSVGLIGWGSKEQVCEDAKTGLPTKIEMPTGIECH